jgi:UDP-N-acetylmuramyl pentapeptide synthase
MSLLTVQELVRATHGAPIGGDLGCVTGVSIDSRSLAVGEAFFAIRGNRLDGHAYVRTPRGAPPAWWSTPCRTRSRSTSR